MLPHYIVQAILLPIYYRIFTLTEFDWSIRYATFLFIFGIASFLIFTYPKKI
jgi:hypothetical protein